MRGRQRPGQRRQPRAAASGSGKDLGASLSPITADTQVIGLDAYLAAREHRALAGSPGACVHCGIAASAASGAITCRRSSATIHFRPTSSSGTRRALPRASPPAWSRGGGMSAPATLERTTFRTSRLLDFASEKELVAQTGHRRSVACGDPQGAGGQRDRRRRGSRHASGDHGHGRSWRDHGRGQRPRHPSRCGRGHPRLQRAGVVTRSLCQSDPRRQGNAGSRRSSPCRSSWMATAA